jgi:hypothetical protein
MEANAVQSLRRVRGEPAQRIDRMVSAEEFRRLLVSHRKMERIDRRSQKLLGLKDLTTGEVFWTDSRWLLEPGR